MKIGIPIPLLIVWIEVNVLGRTTIMPEVFTILFTGFGLLTWVNFIYTREKWSR